MIVIDIQCQKSTDYYMLAIASDNQVIIQELDISCHATLGPHRIHCQCLLYADNYSCCDAFLYNNERRYLNCCSCYQFVPSLSTYLLYLIVTCSYFILVCICTKIAQQQLLNILCLWLLDTLQVLMTLTTIISAYISEALCS